MPIFEYICKECQHEFEALVFGKQKAECPKCQSKKLEPQLSVFAVSAKSGGASQPALAGGTLRVVRRCSRAGSLLAERPRLSPASAPKGAFITQHLRHALIRNQTCTERCCNVTSGTLWRVTDVTFRWEAFLVMIRLHRSVKIRSSSSGEAVIQALPYEPPILGIGLPKVCENGGDRQPTPNGTGRPANVDSRGRFPPFPFPR